VDRIRTASSARGEDSFFLIARTDAIAQEGVSKAIERSRAYVAAGADAIFAEAITDLDSYRTFTEELNVPILANITEFGVTPLFSLEELRSVKVGMALYPLSAFRAMNKAAEKVYQTIRQTGTQKSVIDTMQTREELYERINYHEFEARLDSFNRDQK
jgi:methylisocitrate lyase